MVDRSVRPARGPLRRQVARGVSIVLHPFVMSLLLVVRGSLAELPPGRALGIVALVLGGTIVPLLAYLERQVRAGRVDFDVTVRQRRGPLFALGLAAGGLLVAALLLLATPWSLVVVALAAVLLLAAASLVNRRLKASLHTAFALFAGLSLLAWDPRLAAAVLLLSPLVAWSRLELRRHDWPEVLAGAVLGAVAGGGVWGVVEMCRVA